MIKKDPHGIIIDGKDHAIHKDPLSILNLLASFEKNPTFNLDDFIDYPLFQSKPEKAPEFDGITETRGLNHLRSTFFNGHVEIFSHDIISPRQISFTADNVKCVTSKCDRDGNAAAVLLFTSAKGEKATVIMTEGELQATLKGRQYQKMMLSAEKAFEGSENQYDFYPRTPISGTVRPDFVSVFEDALQQVRDAKVLVRLGRNKGEVGLFETAPTNVMQLVAGGQVVTAYATRDFPRGEIGTKRNVGIRHG